MIRAKYTSAKYDSLLPRVIGHVTLATQTNNDDFMLLIVGDPGTGKSVLTLHIIEMYLGTEADVKYIGLRRNDFARALNYAKDKQGKKFCCNDEANISNRDGFSQYTKDLIDLYLSIRGVNIFHVWNNPVLQMLDKYFINDRIKGVIYIATKDTKLPRVYYYFRKTDIVKIYEKYGDLKLSTLKKARKEYAYYRGWFRDYDGVLLKPYLEKKALRMDEKIKAFCDEYGKEESDMTITEIARELSLTTETIRNYTKQHLGTGKIGDLMSKSAAGRWKYKPEAIQVFKKIAEERKQRQEGTWKASSQA